MYKFVSAISFLQDTNQYFGTVFLGPTAPIQFTSFSRSNRTENKLLDKTRCNYIDYPLLSVSQKEVLLFSTGFLIQSQDLETRSFHVSKPTQFGRWRGSPASSAFCSTSPSSSASSPVHLTAKRNAKTNSLFLF